MRHLLPAALCGSLLLAACGSDDTASTAPVITTPTSPPAPTPPAAPAPTPLTGVLVDSLVQGVSFRSSSGITGTTNARGEFSCLAADNISFTLGGVALGTATCGSTLTPIELAGRNAKPGDAVVDNRLVFLQALDADDDPANGIVIPAAVAADLAGKTLDFGKAAADFNADLAALMPARADQFGAAYNSRMIDDKRRSVAREHFSGSLAALGRTAEAVRKVSDAAAGDLQITSYQLQAATSFNVPYTGSIAGIKADFTNGFYPAAGSGLAYQGMKDGNLEFLAITDRGPNGDGPKGTWTEGSTSYTLSKVFPAPSFAPSIGLITVGKDGAVLKSLTPLSVDATTKVSGLPLAAGATGSTAEAPLTDAMIYDNKKATFDVNGLDTESLVIDTARNSLWVSDEYGPFIVKLDPATYRIIKKYQPGTGATDLPAVLANRRANRGMEGLTLAKGAAAADDRLHGFLQSPIEPFVSGKSVETTDTNDFDQDGKKDDKVSLANFAQFARWIEFNPTTETSKLYAYPLDFAVAGQKWDRNRTGSAKLGDVISLGGGKFLVVEQGADSLGAVRNFLMLVEIPSDVTDITSVGIDLERNSIDTTTSVPVPYANVVKLKKKLLVDLNAAGWVAEKAEGLTLVNGNTIALINDNDFGLRTLLYDANGAVLAGSVQDCTVDANGAITDAGKGSCTVGAVTARVARGSSSERATRLWLIQFPKALASYTQ